MNELRLASDVVRKRKKALKNIEKYLSLIKKRVKRTLGNDASVYVFGSFLNKRKFKPFLSDIDVLITSNKIRKSIRERAKIRAKIERGLPEIFELHLADKEMFKIYRKFVRKMRKV